MYGKRHVAAVEAGENMGKTLTGHHVVRELREVGQWTGDPVEIPLSDLRLGRNEGGAVIVQAHDQGAILGAAACPSQPRSRRLSTLTRVGAPPSNSFIERTKGEKLPNVVRVIEMTLPPLRVVAVKAPGR